MKKLLLIAIPTIAVVAALSYAIPKYIESERAHEAESRRQSDLAFDRNQCSFGFDGSFIYHYEQRLARGETVGNGIGAHAPEQYRQIKAKCDAIGAGPARTDDPRTAPGLDHYVNLLRR